MIYVHTLMILKRNNPSVRNLAHYGRSYFVFSVARSWEGRRIYRLSPYGFGIPQRRVEKL
jgi:hypothetical protein